MQKELFYPTLKRRVDEYFKLNNIDKEGNWELYLKTWILFFLTILFYYSFLHTPPSILSSIFFGICFGILFPLIGFNVMHDASHRAYSGEGWLNTLMSWTADLMGASSILWYYKHPKNHHSGTNTAEDDDLASAWPVLRLSLDQKKLWFHKYQHKYFWLAYCLLFITWVWFNDFKKYFKKKIHTKKITLNDDDHIVFWLGKFAHFYLMLLIPSSYIGWGNTLIFYGVLCVVCGFILSIVFQLAHVNEKTNLLAEKEEGRPWGENQALETANFSPQSWWADFLFGGLNSQVEHHLFQTISHVHYKSIRKIVMDTCEEYGVRYNVFATMIEAIHSHKVTLRKLGAAA
jgi:linoleoyl-CoA desaturase